MQSSQSPVILARSRPLHATTRPGGQQQQQRSAAGFPSSPAAPFPVNHHPHHRGAYSQKQQHRRNRNLHHHHCNNNNRTMEAPRRQSRWGDKRPTPPSFSGAVRRPPSSEPRSRWDNASSSNSIMTTPPLSSAVQTPPPATESFAGDASCSGIPFKKRKRFYPQASSAPSSGGPYYNNNNNQQWTAQQQPRLVPPPPPAPQDFTNHAPACERFVTRLDKPQNSPVAAYASPLVMHNNNNAASVKTTTEEDDEKAAIVSDGPHPDSCLETSTASSSSFLGLTARSPVRTADIPRHIETPTTTTAVAESVVWLEDKIPKKNKKVDAVAPVTATPAAALQDFEIPRKKLKINIPRKVSLETKMNASISPLPEREITTAPTGSAAAADSATAENKSSAKATKNAVPAASPKAADKMEVLAPEDTKETMSPPTKSARKESGTNNSRTELTPKACDDSPSEVVKRETSGSADASRLLESPDAPSPLEPELSAKALRCKTKYLRVQIGARVSVFWDGENTYYDATVTRERPHKKKRFFVEYDDGDREWINLRREKWRLLGGGKSVEEISTQEPSSKAETPSKAVDQETEKSAHDASHATNAVSEEKREKSQNCSKLSADASLLSETVPRKSKKPTVAANDLGETKTIVENDKAKGRLSKKKIFDEEKNEVAAFPNEKVPRKVNGQVVVPNDLPETNASKEEPQMKPSLLKKKSVECKSTEAVSPTAKESRTIVTDEALAAKASTTDVQTEPASKKKTSDDSSQEVPARVENEKKQKASSAESKTPLLTKEELQARKAARTAKKKSGKFRKGFNSSDRMDDDDWVSKAARKSDSDSETDDDEVLTFARQMLGVERPEVRHRRKFEPFVEPDWAKDVHIPISEKVKLGRRSRPETLDETEVKRPKKKRKKFPQMKVIAATPVERAESAKAEPDCSGSKSSTAVSVTATEISKPVVAESAATDLEAEKRRKKEEARTLTAEEITAILGEEVDPCAGSTHWVRRSARMPSRSVLNTPRFKQLIDKLKTNDPDMVVLKMKKYLSDPDCPQVCIDTVLDALEENTNCQSLYIQNFNEGMRDAQVLRLLEILKKPSCSIWCLNIGETYKVKTRTWKIFTRGLKHTKITHMYASEHTISSELKEKIRTTIRDNRKKHNMHIDPENLDVIVKCTHCWWNPINAKVLRPHLHRKGYAHMLNPEAQGLQGTTSGATLA